MCVTAAKDGVLIRRRLRIFAAATALVLLCVVCVGSASAWSADTTWGADYDSASVFYIEDADDLAQFASLVNGGKNFAGKRVVLNADIDLENQAWISIGSKRSTPFAGTFDGNGHTISRLYQEVGFLADTMVGGLFGYVSGTILDVTVTQSTLKTKGMPTVGFVVGVLISGNVNHCVVTSSKITTTLFGWVGSIIGGCTIGGVVGKNEEGIVYDTTTMDDVQFPNIFDSWFGTVYNYEIVGNGQLTPTEDNSTFTITATAGENGSISPSGELIVAKGSSITYGFSPDSGYVIEQVLVNGEDYTDFCLSHGNTYTIEGVSKDYTISVTFKEGVGYIITIPDTLIISEDTETGTMDITPTYLWIPETSSLEVQVESANKFDLVYTDDASITLAYVLKKGTSVIQNRNVAATFTMAEQNSVTLSAVLTGNVRYAGEYTDTLTFTVAVVPGTA